MFCSESCHRRINECSTPFFFHLSVLYLPPEVHCFHTDKDESEPGMAGLDFCHMPTSKTSYRARREHSISACLRSTSKDRVKDILSFGSHLIIFIHIYFHMKLMYVTLTSGERKPGKK